MIVTLVTFAAVNSAFLDTLLQKYAKRVKFRFKTYSYEKVLKGMSEDETVKDVIVRTHLSDQVLVQIIGIKASISFKSL